MSSISSMDTTSAPVMPILDHKMEKSVKGKGMSLEERISTSAVATMQLLSLRMQKKSEECLTRPSALNAGVFYPNTYYELLKKMLEAPLAVKVKSTIAKRLQVMEKNNNFYDGIAPKEFFKPFSLKDSVSGLMPCVYALKDSTVRPSRALMAILEDKCLIFIDCATAVQIAYYKALLDLLGEEKFDYIFAADGPIPFSLGQSHPKNPLLFLTRKLRRGDPFTEGCWAYKANTNLYASKHMHGGECVGFNFLYSGKRYFGFGLKAEGVTEEELDQVFVAEYNREPFGNKGLTQEFAQKIESTYTKAQLEKSKDMQNHTISVEEYRKTEGGKILGANILNPDRVKALMLFNSVAARALFK